jgi:hypothetical protein
MPKGPKGERRPADLSRRAFAIVQSASGEADDNPKQARRAEAGKAGGKARAKALTAEQRKAIAEKAAKARWSK